MNTQKQEVMNSMSRINRKLFTANGHEEEFIGRSQINILKEIIEHQKITQEELAKALNLDKTTIAKAVKRLEIKGLITRKRQENDLRKKELVATEKALVVKEKMKQHMMESTEAFFEGISEEALESFKDTLEKIESNIEKQRKVMHDQKHLGMKILKELEKTKGLTTAKLAEVLGKESEQVNRIVGKLISENFIEEKDGKLSITKIAIEHKKDHEREKKEHGKGHKAHKEVFKIILKNQGITKAVLIEKSEMDEHEIEDLLNHLESKGVLEIKDGKIYADQEKLKGKHRH